MKEFKPIRKSAFMDFKKCPYKFYLFYNDPNYWDYGKEDSDKTGDLRKWRGNEFHHYVETFFDKITLDETDQNQFRDMLPTHEDSIVNDWFDWFAKTEWDRFQELSAKKMVDEFKPIANELKVLYEDEIGRTGHIDRIDKVPGQKELCIVEYKAGQSYDMGIVDRATSMNAEIGWYVQILNGMEKYEGYGISHWKVINPLLQKVWINKISPISLSNVERVYRDIVDRLKNNKKFEKKPSPLCYHCPYLKQCNPFYEEDCGIKFV